MLDYEKIDNNSPTNSDNVDNREKWEKYLKGMNKDEIIDCIDYLCDNLRILKEENDKLRNELFRKKFLFRYSNEEKLKHLEFSEED